MLLAGCFDQPGAGTAKLDAGGAPLKDLGNGVLDAALPLQRIEPTSESELAADPTGTTLAYGGIGVWSSTDGGLTWTAAQPFSISGNLDGWTIAFDEAGHLFAANTEGPNVKVGRSSDGGASWDAINYVSGVGLGLADRPWIAAHGDGQLALMVGDLALQALGNYERCFTSKDGGATWLDVDVGGSPGPTGGLAFDAAGDFYGVSQQGVVQQFGGSCLPSPQTHAAFQAPINAEELPIATAGTAAYTAATDAGSGAVVVGGVRGGVAHQVAVSPPQLKTSLYTAVAARGEDVAALWYGSSTAGDYQSQGFDGDFDVYVAVVHGFWGNSTIQVFKVNDTPAHHGGICRNGLSCTFGRGPGDYFDIEYDAAGALHAAFASDTVGGATYHVGLSAAFLAAHPGRLAN